MEAQTQIPDDRIEVLRQFDETKAGVKGLSDSGILKLPRIFVRPPEDLSKDLSCNINNTPIQVPVIDMADFQADTWRRRRIVEQVRAASETWGFFQVVNHGIPQSVLDDVINGVREFHEQDLEKKKLFYTRDTSKALRLCCNHDLFKAATAGWRDTLSVSFPAFDPDLHRHELPPSFSKSIVEYSKHVETLGNILFGLLSEALGLETGYLEKMECSKGHRLHGHYYPACPEPHLAIGTTQHSDAGFLTILLQNQITSALQVLYKGQWIDIQPTPGGLVINIGDLLQLVSNGKFKSNQHRAIAKGIGPRISIACFFSGPLMNVEKIYGPIEELISDENPAVYKELVLGEYVKRFITTSLETFRALDCYKL
ncbi:1-aminocyclopropane-1-carboxylate oxidase homolog 1-like [Andrographis paniculata]|uniref:1-aminocyclopropane-1-carboxylate oxidase homolog 1-like n=1 Tax=Andrographis paniculata TaxID=175694 RepID=UPI0021E8018B|nr:1-aminocyclopropane-1-carboxylate oxidase homolog 1-like [Andrographis paniculata]